MNYVGTIFLDGNSTTPVDPRVARAVCSAYRRPLGNASSLHRFGWRARCLLEQARRNIALFLHAENDEIYFVPSVTVGLNIAIFGLLAESSGITKRIASSRLEHRSIMAIIKYACAKRGCEWVELEHDRFGSVIPESVTYATIKGVDLICVSHGNGEIGSLNDVNQIVDASQGGSALIVDASQTAAYLELPGKADCLLVSGHKLYGPRGIAALSKRRKLELRPILMGAGQEGGLLPGTEDVPGAIALGVAARLAEREREERCKHINALRDIFLGILVEKVPDIELNGPPADRLPGNLSVTVSKVSAELIMKQLPHLALSMASACVGAGESHVLRALGFSKARIASTFRLGFNAYNTEEEAERAADDIATMITQVRRRQ